MFLINLSVKNINVSLPTFLTVCCRDRGYILSMSLCIFPCKESHYLQSTELILSQCSCTILMALFTSSPSALPCIISEPELWKNWLKVSKQEKTNRCFVTWKTHFSVRNIITSYWLSSFQLPIATQVGSIRPNLISWTGFFPYKKPDLHKSKLKATN